MSNLDDVLQPFNNLGANLTPTGILTGQLSIGGPVPSDVLNLPTLSTLRGSNVTFTTDIEDNFYKMIDYFSFTQSGSGAPSPTNIRPITIYDRVNLSLNGQTDELSFNGAYAAGSYDILTGRIIATHGYIIDLSTITWQKISVYQGKKAFMTGLISDLKPNTASSQVPDVTCSHYQTLNGDGVYLANRQGISLWSTQKRLAIYDPDKENMDATQFKNSLSGVTVTYKYQMDLWYYVTPQIFTTLIGTNNIAVDVGEIEVSYLETVGHKIGGT